MASGLSKQVRRIENCISLLGAFSDRLRYLRPPMSQLIEGAAAMEQFGDMGFLLCCRNTMRSGIPFPQSWRLAVQKSRDELGRELAEILLPLGEVLGSSDLESSLAALEHTRALLENRLEDARAYRERHAKLYQSLGVLCGLALVILFI